MYRVINSSVLKNCKAITDCMSCAQVLPFQVQCVRWIKKVHKRKPIYLGTAKSKLFRFPVRKTYLPGELEEVMKLNNDYRHFMKSLYNYFKTEYAKTSDTSALAAKMQQVEEEEHVRLMEENRLENERITKLRMLRIQAEVEKKKEAILQSFVEMEEKDKARLQEAEKIVLKEKEQASTFITLETLDDAIEKAVNSEVDYNFAIDFAGNVYKGRRAVVGASNISEKFQQKQAANP